MELVGFNPLNRRSTYVETCPHTGETIIRELFDKSHALEVKDRAQLLKAEGLARGENMRLAFSLPPYLQVEILEKFGVDWRERDHWPALFNIVRTEYPHLIVNT